MPPHTYGYRSHSTSNEYIDATSCLEHSALYPDKERYVLFLVVIMANSDNSEPPCMDVETPEGSIQGNDQCAWDEREAKIILAHSDYHSKMWEALQGAFQHGLYPAVPPKKPKGDIGFVFGIEKKQSKKLTGQTLHEYLVKNLAKQDPAGRPAGRCLPPTNLNQITNLDQIKEDLRVGYKRLQQSNAKTISVSLDLGERLDIAFELHKLEKLTGKISLSWKEWLEHQENVGIQVSYADKLRQMWKLLGSYPRFRKLGLSFSEVYSKRNEIQGMLRLNPDLAKYWKVDDHQN